MERPEVTRGFEEPWVFDVSALEILTIDEFNKAVKGTGWEQNAVENTEAVDLGKDPLLGDTDAGQHLADKLVINGIIEN
jgi:hypothetical protein